MAKKAIEIKTPLQQIFGKDFNFPLLLNVIKRSLIWIILFILLAIGGVYMYLRYTVPIYQATSSLIYTEPEAEKIADFGNSQQHDLSADIELIRSPEMIENVVRQLPLDVTVYAEGTVLTNVFYDDSPLQITSLVKDSSIYGRHIHVSVSSNGRYNLFYEGVSQKNLEFGKAYETPHFHYSIRPRTNTDEYISLLSERDYYFTFNSIPTLVSSVSSSLSVSPSRNNRKILVVSITDRKASKAIDLANTIAKEYVEFDEDYRKSSETSKLAFIRKQLDTLGLDLNRHTDTIKSFQRDKSIVSPEAEQGLLFTELKDLENSLLEIQIQKSAIQRLEQYIKNGQNLAALTGDVIEGDYTGFNTYIQEIRGLEREKEELLMSVKPNNERVQFKEKQIEVAKNNLLVNIQNALERLNFRQQEIRRQYAEVQREFGLLPEKKAEFTRLNRLGEMKEQFYLVFLEKEMESEIRLAGIQSNFRMLQEAKGASLVSPQKRQIQVLGLGLGLLAGLALVVVRYLMQNKILGVQDIQDYTDVPVLGIVPKMKALQEHSTIVIYRNPKSLISEAFRSIRTNLEFLSDQEKSTSLAVTSTISGEGKTFIALNLAAVINMTDRKVIVLDLDMRKPKIHKAFEVENVKGMSTVLINRHSIEEAIQHSKQNGLDFITAGPLPPNPAELIVSQRLKEVVDELKSIYDVVVIDTPPIGLVADALELIRSIDHPIYVLRANYSRRDFINLPNRLFEENKVPRLSIVLNEVNMGSGGYSYSYGYGYGYGYGSGSGYYSEDSEPRRSLWNRLSNFLTVRQK